VLSSGKCRGLRKDFVDIAPFSNRPLPDRPPDPNSLEQGWQSLENLNTIESCDPHSFIALYDFKGETEEHLNIKANQEVGVCLIH
jgi:hypothetical protein